MLYARVAFLIAILVISASLLTGLSKQESFGSAFKNPLQLSSENGVLEVTFDTSMSPAEVNGKPFISAQYNGSVAPPTLRVKPGDTIKLTVNNKLEAMTNVHYHGMQVSPKSPSDDIFIMISPNSSFDYTVKIPQDHPEGMYYYHAHLAGITQFQIMSGLSGGLIVEGVTNPFPQLNGVKEQIMYLKDFQIHDGAIPPEADIDPSAPTNFTVNGQTNPVINMRPGETQFWKLFNIGADVYYDLEMDGITFYQIERDGYRQTRTLEKNELLIPTSARMGVLVQPKEKGTYQLRAKKFNTGPAGDNYGGATLLTLKVEGDPVEVPIALPIPEQEFPKVENLCDIPVDNKRTIVFSETSDGNTFFINNREFDPARIDTTVNVGTVEEWRIQNISEELHVFHIHLTDFQVCEINGKKQPFNGRQDTVNVPYMGQDPDVKGPGEVKVVIDFREPQIVGKAVYHCHIGEHEDNGMMAVFEVVQPE
ncbi:MAG: multicopper oxidase family protein [Thermodesulfobacteriota bacterium]